MYEWIIEKWDWFIYHRAHSSLERICRRRPGFAYLLELWIREWRSRNPASPEVDRATEVFFESMRETIDARK